MTFDITKIARPNILTLEPYRCARDDFQEGILLDANENTYGPTLKNISSEESALGLNRYPDPHQIALKKQICAYRNSEAEKPGSLVKIPTDSNGKSQGLTAANLCLGVGSDEGIDILIRACVKPGVEKVMICPPTYGMYSICCVVNDVEIVKVPLELDTFQIQPEKILDQLRKDPDIKLIYITSPGNPTAQLIKQSLILQVLKGIEELSWNGLLLLDEAYIDFAPSGSSMSVLVNKHKNLAVMQTFSKAFGLAGIRLGITYSTPEVSILLNSMKYPYNISNITSSIALRATTEGSLNNMKHVVGTIIEQRAIVLEKILKINGVGRNVGGTDSNFILIELLNKDGKPDNKVAHEVYSRLATERHVVVRFRGSELGCTGCLRITIGTPAENEKLLEEFETVLTDVNK
ncbi:DEKNAAC102593 [Brettanomyces naardenensis]|uniref:histidinol-phosphate transaminase n=1 Tax=Brettanomyces naardenensis TaxID=13370 RepID=A0A448YKH3_BRENA|nr:DEKNAAC102593 [Brettanomyces naardenensis]